MCIRDSTVECADTEFTAKGRTVKQPGWRALDAAYRASMKNAEPDKETEDVYKRQLCGSAGAGGLCGAFQHGGLPHAGGMV